MLATFARANTPRITKSFTVQSHLLYQGRSTMGAFCSSDEKPGVAAPQPPPPNKRPKSKGEAPTNTTLAVAVAYTLPAKVSIQYCGAWGYGKYSNALKDILISEFDTDVEITLSADQGKTGNFEVKIENSNELIHSKSNGQGGRCETSAEQQAVIDKVQAYIDDCE